MKTKVLVSAILVLILAGSIAIWAQAPESPKEAKAAAAPAGKPAPEGGITQPERPVPPELTGKTRFEGIIINMEGMAAGATFFSVEIDRWSTPDEIKEAKSALANQGTQGLLQKVWDAKQVGYLKIRNSLGKPIHFARAIPIPGGYIVRLLMDTPISHVGQRSRDYPFGFIEMVVPVEGKTKGHGSIVGMAQFSFDEQGAIQVAAYGNMPARLEEIEIKQPKK